jgi:hypothetical protein
MVHGEKIVKHFFVLGLLLKTEGQKNSKSSGHFNCDERYSKRDRNIAKREEKPTYTNAIFQHAFVILCAHVCKHNFCCLELQILNIYFSNVIC